MDGVKLVVWGIDTLLGVLNVRWWEHRKGWQEKRRREEGRTRWGAGVLNELREVEGGPLIYSSILGRRGVPLARLGRLEPMWSLL